MVSPVFVIIFERGKRVPLMWRTEGERPES